MKYLILFSLLIHTSVFAFDCKEIEGKEFLSPGDSDFQYHYRFEAKKALLYAYTMSHDVADKGKKVKKDKFTGSYSFDEKNKDQFTLKIKVDGVNHKITFKCVDKDQYMAAGPFSKKLEVFKTVPERHGFSLIDLWPKDSPVIRRYLPKDH